MLRARLLASATLETLLALAVTQNNRGLWVILPKNAGSIEPVQLATYSDQEGTLDGKPIIVHHLVATIAGADTDLFSGRENQILQANCRRRVSRSFEMVLCSSPRPSQLSRLGRDGFAAAAEPGALTAQRGTPSSCYPTSQNRDLHPTDESLSVGAPGSPPHGRKPAGKFW